MAGGSDRRARRGPENARRNRNYAQWLRSRADALEDDQWTRESEAIEKAAWADWERTYFAPWDEATDAEREAWIESTAHVITIYNAHMRPTVTTVDELNALPVGTVVLDYYDAPWWRDSDGEGVWWWERPGSEEGCTSDEIHLPARVIHWGDE